MSPSRTIYIDKVPILWHLGTVTGDSENMAKTQQPVDITIHEGAGPGDVFMSVRTAEPEGSGAAPLPALPLMRAGAAPAVYPVEALGDVLAPAVTAIAARAQVPLALAAQNVLAVVVGAVQRHVDVVLPTIGVRPVSSYFVSAIERGEHADLAADLAARPVQDPDAGLIYDPEDVKAALVRAHAVTLFADHAPVVRSSRTAGLRPRESVRLWGARLHKSEPRRLTQHLTLAPDATRAFLADSAVRAAGLHARLLVAAPPTNIGARGWNRSETEDPAIGRYRAAFEPWRDSLPAAETGMSLTPRPLAMSADAEAVWMGHAEDNERALAAGGVYECIKDFGAHVPEHAARLAAALAG